MARLEQDVEVVGITHAVAAGDGSSLYQVAFGRIGKASFQPPGAVLPAGAQVATVWAVLFAPARSPSPYAMGSEWRLILQDDGSFTIKARGKAGRSRPNAPAPVKKG
jgi:hypothetical protein